MVVPSGVPGAPRLVSSHERELLSTDSDFCLLLTPAGTVLGMSDTVADLLGWDFRAWKEENLWATLGKTSDEVVLRSLVDRATVDGAARMTVQLASMAGGLWVDAAAKRLDDDPRQAVLVTARDVTHDREAAAALARSEQQWRMAFEQSPIGGALLDGSGAVLVVNEALCKMTGISDLQLIGMDAVDLVLHHGGQPWNAWWSSLLRSGADEVDRMIGTADGGHIWVRLTAATNGGESSGLRVVLQVEDITSRRENELALAERALNDDLTGTPNRFLTRQWLASALEDNPTGGVGVLYCDVDRFKVVNDSLGHAAGDDLLVQVAHRMRDALSPEDLLGRVGGDEFVVVVERIRGGGALAETAARLADALAEPFILGGHRHAVTISIGGTVGGCEDRADDMLVRADLALLRAKQLGRARYVAFDDTHDKVTTAEDLQLEDDLRVSLKAGQIRAFYQPVVALVDRDIVGFEALVRWEHPRHGLLPPARFLDLAESSGLIRPLGWWMLEQACTDAATGASGLEGGRWVAVNASAAQLSRPGFAGSVLQALTHTGLPPSRLHLEVTETALITAPEGLAGELRQLSEQGVHIALDDFGTGYSSLTMLRQFPVDVVKIDRSFVSPLLVDRGALAIVRAVLGMCAEMGLTTVAEGVESEEQYELLRLMGCTHGQGYLFGRATPLASRHPQLRQRSAGDPATKKGQFV